MSLVFTNNARSTLAGAITNTSTTLQVAAGTGVLYPNPSSSQYFVLTLNDAATGLDTEIMWCIARNGDTLTVVRGQEGTSAQSWAAGDIVWHGWTAGQASTILAAAAGTPTAFVAQQSMSFTQSMAQGVAAVVQYQSANTVDFGTWDGVSNFTVTQTGVYVLAMQVAVSTTINAVTQFGVDCGIFIDGYGAGGQQALMSGGPGTFISYPSSCTVKNINSGSVIQTRVLANSNAGWGSGTTTNTGLSLPTGANVFGIARIG